MASNKTNGDNMVGAERIKRPLTERAEKKRKTITGAAFTVFVTEGAAANLDRIADTAGVSKVTIYNYFESKDHLLLSVVDEELLRAHEETVRFIDKRLKDESDIFDALVSLSRIWVSGLTSARIMQLRIIVSSQAQRLPELGEAWMRSGPKRLHRRIAEALTILAQRFDISFPDVDLAVLQLAGLVVSPHVMYGPFGAPPDKATTDALIESGVRMFLGYYGRSADQASL